MSLLRDVLKRKNASPDSPLPTTSKRSVKRYASSIKSSGGASMRSLAGSMLSFYSAMTGSSGTRVPKRRLPDISKLGVPEWYAENPPPPSPMPGTAAASSAPAFTSGNASVLYVPEGEKQWLGLVLYSHARPESKMAVYHNAAKVTGEVRMVLDAPTNLGSIDVWVVIASDSANDNFKPPITAMKVMVWNRKMGDPRSTTAGGAPFTGKFPAGSFVFPFELLALPQDTLVKNPDDTKKRNQARVPLPPTYFVSKVLGFWGSVKYVAGVNVVREGLGAINDEFDMEFQYLPLAKSLPRVKTPFPYLPGRTGPSPARGRLGEQFAEVEGILGIQEPAVYTAGQIVEFSLLLWSANPRALEALGRPGAVEVGFFKADVFAANSLDPITASRRDRYTGKLAEGRIWLADDGRPADDVHAPQTLMLKLPVQWTGPKGSPLGSGSHESYHAKGAMPARMQEVHAADVGDEDATLADASTESEADSKHRAPSPTPSFEDLDVEDPHQTDHFVRLDGEVRVPTCSHPSFRYHNMGREYYLNLLIRHPQYSHMSPSGVGIVAECPVWYVVDRFAGRSAEVKTPDFGELPVSGTEIALGPDAVRVSSSSLAGSLLYETRDVFVGRY
ncbi:hypothetical protein DFH06DRAFT_1425667 [Mycena polygramma]|nr:hypothetical protein DFH06DRAFT_1425667 [Mycena polygramma]